jgi:signal transduction histidine kinase
LATRRYRELGREIIEREAAERDLAQALADNRTLANESIRGQEAERRHLAAELHDELGQYLNAIKIEAVSLRGIDGRHRIVEDAVTGIIQNVDHVHAAVMSIIGRLRPVALDELGLAAALEHCTGLWRRQLPNTRVELEIHGVVDDFGEALNLTLYRMVQEGLTNVAKHASARNVIVSLASTLETGDSSGNVRLLIRDDGVGDHLAPRSKGLGLINMRERVAMLAGQFEVRTGPGAGFAIEATFPVGTP